MIVRWITIFILFLSQILIAQNIGLYLTLIEKGRIEEVKDNLPELLDRYPDQAGVYYLQALVNDDGDSSLEQFRGIIKKFPQSEFAAESEMKIGEYLFARGLYSQSSVQFKSTIYKYPNSQHHQRAMDLMVNSYMATGESDSARIALKTIKQLYPSLKFDHYGLEGMDNSSREARLVRLDPNVTSGKIKARKSSKRVTIPRPISKPWVIQVGAFGKYENANRLKKQLQGHGYGTEIHTVNSNGKRLHAVRIVRYETKAAAEKIGKKLKKKFGLDFRVINNPE